MAMASRMAMIRTTTMSSMRVKPSSSRSKRFLRLCSMWGVSLFDDGNGLRAHVQPLGPLPVSSPVSGPPGSPADRPPPVAGVRSRGIAPPPFDGFAFVRSTLLALATSPSGDADLSAFSPLLLDQLDDVEHRHVQRHDHAAHGTAEHDDQGGLQERRQGVDRGLDLLLVELADLLEHLVERAGLFADGHH